MASRQEARSQSSCQGACKTSAHAPCQVRVSLYLVLLSTGWLANLSLVWWAVPAQLSLLLTQWLPGCRLHGGVEPGLDSSPPAGLKRSPRVAARSPAQRQVCSSRLSLPSELHVD